MNMDEYEEIPWSTLLGEHRDGRRRTIYIAAAVVVAFVIGVAGIRWLTAPGHGEAPAAGPVPIATTIGTTVPDTSPPTTATLTEADLLAIEPATAEYGAVARAEWFVTDFFTVDGPMPEELLSAFVNDAVLPDLPSGEDAGTSYVEWARAYDVRPTPDGYAVFVVFRCLTEEDDGSFVRGPVRAVEVLVAVRDGETAIADLPVPILPPVYHTIDGWMHTDGEAGDDAVAAALEYAGLFDENAEVIESGADGPDWRVVFTVGDRSGNRWPLVMRSDTIPGS